MSFENCLFLHAVCKNVSLGRLWSWLLEQKASHRSKSFAAVGNEEQPLSTDLTGRYSAPNSELLYRYDFGALIALYTFRKIVERSRKSTVKVIIHTILSFAS